jgi:hypothetical protein
MRSLFSATLCALLAICLMPPAEAQDRSRLLQPPPGAATLPGSLTGKERLGKKWMDEQRIDNCNVPVDKRGTKLRPSTCSPGPAG